MKVGWDDEDKQVGVFKARVYNGCDTKYKTIDEVKWFFIGFPTIFSTLLTLLIPAGNVSWAQLPSGVFSKPTTFFLLLWWRQIYLFKDF